MASARELRADSSYATRTDCTPASAPSDVSEDFVRQPVPGQSMYKATKYAVKYDPPCLFLEYEDADSTRRVRAVSTPAEWIQTSQLCQPELLPEHNVAFLLAAGQAEHDPAGCRH